MNHYWTAADPPALRQAQIDDWLEDMVEFGPMVVAVACGEWRRTQPRRPTPAEIRLLCIAAQREHRERHPAEQTYLPPQDARAAREARHREHEHRGEAMQREGRAKANEWAQRQGYHDLDAYAEAKRVHISEAYRLVIAEILAGSPIDKSVMTVVQQLGVKAREYTPEEMRRGRIELGLEDASPPEPRAAEQ